MEETPAISDNPVEMWKISRKESKALIIKQKFEI